jgi:hypothetical protein
MTVKTAVGRGAGHDRSYPFLQPKGTDPMNLNWKDCGNVIHILQIGTGPFPTVLVRITTQYTHPDGQAKAYRVYQESERIGDYDNLAEAKRVAQYTARLTLDSLKAQLSSL